MKISGFMCKIKQHIDLKHCVIRMVMAWCFVCLVEAVWIGFTKGKYISTLSYVGDIVLLPHILAIAAAFLVLYTLFELFRKSGSKR